ncbi:MAG: ATP phosphoribosyltransferase regulatory subunit [Clostridia bacterium]|nr:ATP phosphoribosyltransferase regulatory subunit [Clostridia bacterium]
MAAEITLPSPDAAARSLCSLYKQYGYRHFRMSKFEEYDFYARNKSFLVGGSIITFTEPGGRLMALKPDVTLSIVKNAGATPDATQKVYYNEKVYRAENGGEFREITQTGLECVGALGFYDISEVVTLAIRSLDLVSADWILDISHMGFVSGVLAHLGASERTREALVTAIAEKNAPYIELICRENGVADEDRDRLCALAGLYAPFRASLDTLSSLSVNDQTDAALSELEKLCRVLEATGLDRNVNIDFSIVNDMNYYNGVIFRGYINGIPQGVLAGGSYDSLLEKMGKRGRAIGFALYLDLLEQLRAPGDRKDADVLILYDDDTPVGEILRLRDERAAAGERVRVQRGTDAGVTAARIIDLRGKGDGADA